MKQDHSFQLSSLFFFQLFSFSFFSQNISYYLTHILKFDGIQSGFILAFTAISFFIGPFLSVYVIDRLIKAKTLYTILMGIMGLAAALLLFVHDFLPVLLLVFAMYIAMSPTSGIANAVTLGELVRSKGSSNGYGKIRVWGTIGWLASSLLAFAIWTFFPSLFPNLSHDLILTSGFLLTTLGALVAIFIMRQLPEKPIEKKPITSFIPKETLEIFKNPTILLLGVISVLSSILERFYYFGAPLYLKSVGTPENVLPLALMLGQVLEIPMLFLFSRLLGKFGFYKILSFGVLVQILRYALFFTGSPLLGMLALSINGIIFACLGNTITLFLDKHAGDSTRKSLHQLIGLAFGGSAWFIGNMLSGLVFNSLDKSSIDLTSFWVIPLIVSICIAIFYFIFVKRKVQNSPFNLESSVDK